MNTNDKTEQLLTLHETLHRFYDRELIKNKMKTVIFGDMEFGFFYVTGDEGEGNPICVVHKVKAVMELADIKAADDLLGQYDSYLIPEDYKGEIYYSKNAWAL